MLAEFAPKYVVIVAEVTGLKVVSRSVCGYGGNGGRMQICGTAGGGVAGSDSGGGEWSCFEGADRAVAEGSNAVGVGKGGTVVAVGRQGQVHLLWG